MPAPENAPPGARGSVLVVDDYPDAADSLALLLKLHGYQVTIASCGEAALRTCGVVPPDLVLLELKLPDMDGCELARRVRDQAGGAGPRFVAVTTCGLAHDLRRSAEAGIEAHLIKPVESAALLAALRGPVRSSEE